jgi:hypothetical protein
MTTMEHKLRGIEERLAPAECRTAQKVLDQARKLLAAPPQLPALPSDPFTSGTVTEAYITAAIERVDAEARMQRRRAVLMELIEGRGLGRRLRRPRFATRCCTATTAS